ncbi:hypothetical protein ZHAS_00012246 [Anopheles sinensis]|uniref:Uncharacterized protein n=1 Tax=Anopheles sinensis TaxID=74873 RepID=A0A084W2L5_ANOSI|nr:hypothetical protein ZHAS_00012246 [Anopheles sinensis]
MDKTDATKMPLLRFVFLKHCASDMHHLGRGMVEIARSYDRGRVLPPAHGFARRLVSVRSTASTDTKNFCLRDNGKLSSDGTGRRTTSARKTEQSHPKPYYTLAVCILTFSGRAVFDDSKCSIISFGWLEEGQRDLCLAQEKWHTPEKGEPCTFEVTQVYRPK